MQVSVREARAQLSRLLSAVEHGKRVEITRRGKIVAQLASVESVSENQLAVRAAARAKLREDLPVMKTSSVDVIRELREE